MPTIRALYQPGGTTATSKITEDEIIRGFPQLEPYRSQLMPMVAEYYLKHFDEEFNIHNYIVAIGNVLADLAIINRPDSEAWSSYSDAWLTEAVKASSLADTFSMTHETAHMNSLGIIRPATIQVKATWSGIEALLREAATGSCDKFWDKFTDLNNQLGAYITNSLALEELRANISAIEVLRVAPNVREEFINNIYGDGRGKERDRDSEIFHGLHSVTGGDLDYAWLLTILAECLNPTSPLIALAELREILKAESAHLWSGEQWRSWFDSWRTQDAFETVAKMLLNPEMSRISWSATLLGTPNGVVEISCEESMKLPLFFESMRQQLTLPERVRNLTCPFKGRSRSCCGFGHYLRNIWGIIPNQKQHRLKPPSQVCLKRSV
jgi:hypothetical protein